MLAPTSIVFFSQRPSSGIAGWRGVWTAGIGSEGARPALLFAGPVPERWNVGLVFIETPHGPAINCTSSLALFVCGIVRGFRQACFLILENKKVSLLIPKWIRFHFFDASVKHVQISEEWRHIWGLAHTFDAYL